MGDLVDVAASVDLSGADLVPYGRDKAKVLPHVRARGGADGRLILVTAVTPTPAGEGKTTTSVGLADAMRRRGERVVVALREPSLGPCFGIKGGGTGGGRATLMPSTDINLHFTGDLHAVSSAHNLIAAMLDNHLHFHKEPRVDVRRVGWPRVLDMNDRSLRHVVTGLGGQDGMPRQTSFDITAASEVMAMLCLAEDAADLRVRLDRTVVGASELTNGRRRPVTVADLGAGGAAVALLRDALMPNLVQTQEGTPAMVHGGPFANIAHGCSSVIGTRTALRIADWVVTEAGFGADLGAEKFFDIKCRTAGLDPACVVVVTTVRALKWHGGASKDALADEDAAAVDRGLANLAAHLDTIATLGKPAVVAINGRAEDTAAEVEVITRFCEARGVRCAPCTHFANGGAGAETLAEHVVAAADEGAAPFTPLYALTDPPLVKMRKIARAAYGADDVVATPAALQALRRVKLRGWEDLPVCMAKTPVSLSDNAKVRGRPQGFVVTVSDVRPNVGAGFLVAMLGDVTRMPGLPRSPQAAGVDLVNGEIVGVG